MADPGVRTPLLDFFRRGVERARVEIALQRGAGLHAGGGVKYWFGRGRRHRSGLRLDAQVSSRDRSAGLDSARRATVATLNAGFAVLF